jgi:hypothetical protein
LRCRCFFGASFAAAPSRRVACYRCLLGMDKLFLTAMDEASIGLMLSADQQL